MAKQQTDEYEILREACIASYRKVYKDSLAFDMNCVPKEKRLMLTEDQFYIAETKKIKAELYAKNIKVLQDVIDEAYSSESKDPTANILRALEMRNKILFNDLMIDADDSNALNITMAALTREEMEKLDTVEVSLEGSNVANLEKMKEEE